MLNRKIVNQESRNIKLNILLDQAKSIDEIKIYKYSVSISINVINVANCELFEEFHEET